MWGNEAVVTPRGRCPDIKLWKNAFEMQMFRISKICYGQIIQIEFHLIDVVEGWALIGPISLTLFLPILHQGRHHHNHGAAILPNHLQAVERTTFRFITQEQQSNATREMEQMLHSPARSQRLC